MPSIARFRYTIASCLVNPSYFRPTNAEICREILRLVSSSLVKWRSSIDHSLLGRCLEKGSSKNDSKIFSRILCFRSIVGWKSSTKEWTDSQAFCWILPRFYKISMVTFLLPLLTFSYKF